MEKKMNYYLVRTKCGHVGKNHYVEITFPIKAETGKDAARIARQIPRVKHHHWDAIIDCRKVAREEYEKQVRINNNDPYLQIKSKQEQKQIEDLIKDRMITDNHQKELASQKKKSSKPNLKYQKRKYEDDYEDFDYAEFAISY